MTRTKSSSTSQGTASRRATLDALSNAVRGITSPFVCSGSVVVRRAPEISLEDGRLFSVTPAESPYDQAALNEGLSRACAPAKFGAGRRTRYDRSVRDAVQLNASGGAFTVSFDPGSAGVLEEVRRQLAPADPGAISAELYALNVYGRNGHFVPHKDTPRGEGMLGSLVVCLPSHFHGGELVIMHRGADVTLDWGREIAADPDPRRLRWAAFFGDVDHAVEDVWEGSRVTLNYVLRRAGNAGVETTHLDDDAALLSRTLSEALRAGTFLPLGGTLGFPCLHMYSQDARWQKRVTPITRRTAGALKGRDLTIARAALALGLDVTLHPYLVETCADETWRLARFPTPAERRRFGHRMDPYTLEAVFPLAGDSTATEAEEIAWVYDPPIFNLPPQRYRRVSDGDEPLVPAQPGLPAIDLVDACEYSATGYFGNEGADTEFYMYAALHVAVPGAGDPRR